MESTGMEGNINMDTESKVSIHFVMLNEVKHLVYTDCYNLNHRIDNDKYF